MQEATVEKAQEILAKLRDVNVVQARVEVENLQRRHGQWLQLQANHLPDFPYLTVEYLRSITLGIYQIKLAPSYIQQKLQRDEMEILELDVLFKEPGFIRLRIYSRFRRATRYYIWISYNIENNDDDPPIIRYYCTCKSGTRTLGTCVHIANVLWFLGYAKYENNIKYPSTTLLDNILDAGNRMPQENINHRIEVPD